ATKSFIRTGAMLTGSSTFGRPGYLGGRTATLLSTGKVLVTGGAHEDLGRYADAEVYDPAMGTFAFTGSMSTVRDGHTATLLPNGKVLIVGGEGVECSKPGCGVISLATVELYSGGFTVIGELNTRREWHQATLLADGSV